MLGPELITPHQIKELCNVDPEKDLKSHPKWKTNISMQKVDGNDNASYVYFEIAYLEGDIVQATRNVAKIMPGNHTEIAYWTEEAKEKSLAVHKGKGCLIIGDPNKETTEKTSVDASIQEEVFLPPGRFYAIQADPNNIEPLVISGFYQPPPDWKVLEIELEAGQNYVQAEEGIRNIPEDFRALLGH